MNMRRMHNNDTVGYVYMNKLILYTAHKGINGPWDNDCMTRIWDCIRLLDFVTTLYNLYPRYEDFLNAKRCEGYRINTYQQSS